MISFLKGNIVAHFEGGIVIENNGIGYKIFVPDNSDIYLKKEDEEVKVHTELVVREDDMSLYGFSTVIELNLFKLLTTVNGVGAKASMAILSSMPIDMIQKAIAYEDVVALTKANGIGKKTAQRIVLEIKDKVSINEYEQTERDSESNVEKVISYNSVENEVVEALISLGYSKIESIDAVSKINEKCDTVEEMIKLALRKI